MEGAFFAKNENAKQFVETESLPIFRPNWTKDCPNEPNVRINKVSSSEGERQSVNKKQKKQWSLSIAFSFKYKYTISLQRLLIAYQV
ncbi:MAG: hypothetical protein LPK26_12685 [Bacillaceae bacterium]|nr:hypothetical protein [Bacillaceae bacterium]